MENSSPLSGLAKRKALWRRLPGLAPGQAIVAFPHLTRPLLIAVDPAPARLRLVD